jgi:hypothetical protein
MVKDDKDDTERKARKSASDILQTTRVAATHRDLHAVASFGTPA